MAPQLTPAPAQLRRSGRIQPPARRIQLDSDLLSLSTHPSEPLLAVGESSGRVSVWGWPNDSDNNGHHNNNYGGVWERLMVEDEYWWQKKWSTKRHKGSTRCVGFSGDGDGRQHNPFKFCPQPDQIFWNACWSRFQNTNEAS